MVKNILIVDDEERARSRLSRLLLDINPKFKIEMAVNGIEALKCISVNKPDILFLDIQMPIMTGLEVLAQIKEREFQVIFQTAYDEYALHAFEANACDYLLKPIERERLKVALEKAVKLKTLQENLINLESEFHRRGQYLQTICVKTGDRISTVKVDDVYCFSSQDHYTFVYTESGEHIIDLPLSHLEDRLNPESFFRCHRSHIVSLEKIKSLNLGPSMEVVFENKRRVPVSRQNRKQMKGMIQVS